MGALFNRIKAFQQWPLVALAVCLIAGYYGYTYFAYYDTRTDDAYLSAEVITIAPPITGQITAVYVRDNQKVKQGDSLLTITPFLEQQLDVHHALTLHAPVNGFVSHIGTQTGQFVTQGQPLFGLIDNRHWFVLARYRETALRLIKPGEKARVQVDMYPKITFEGQVDSIGYGINRSEYGNNPASPLPYFTPTENWIKIAQRFPVKITLPANNPTTPFRIGASVRVHVIP
jgi:multidrug efflux system membrane fusion protein